MNIAKLSPSIRNLLNVLVIIISAGICIMLLPTRWAGMEIFGIGPSWLVMWTIAWSIRRSFWQATTAGIILGFIQDGMTSISTHPIGTTASHVVSLTVVGVLTVWLRKRRYINDGLIAITITTFLLTLLSETILGVQHLLQMITVQLPDFNSLTMNQMWNHQSLAMLITALLSSLWMPILYQPLNLWWQKVLAFTKIN
jgi:rod shape-determining protein MreD